VSENVTEIETETETEIGTETGTAPVLRGGSAVPRPRPLIAMSQGQAVEMTIGNESATVTKMQIDDVIGAANETIDSVNETSGHVTEIPLGVVLTDAVNEVEMQATGETTESARVIETIGTGDVTEAESGILTTDETELIVETMIVRNTSKSTATCLAEAARGVVHAAGTETLIETEIGIVTVTVTETVTGTESAIETGKTEIAIETGTVNGTGTETETEIGTEIETEIGSVSEAESETETGTGIETVTTGSAGDIEPGRRLKAETGAENGVCCISKPLGERSKCSLL
jgi:hypothetical protein